VGVAGGKCRAADQVGRVRKKFKNLCVCLCPKVHQVHIFPCPDFPAVVLPVPHLQGWVLLQAAQEQALCHYLHARGAAHLQGMGPSREEAWDGGMGQGHSPTNL
jgi:hypothetical protein